MFGAHGRTRTYNISLLRRAPLPIGLRGQNLAETARIELARTGEIIIYIRLNAQQVFIDVLIAGCSAVKLRLHLKVVGGAGFEPAKSLRASSFQSSCSDQTELTTVIFIHLD